MVGGEGEEEDVDEKPVQVKDIIFIRSILIYCNTMTHN